MAGETPTRDLESREWSEGTVVQRQGEAEERWHPAGIVEWEKGWQKVPQDWRTRVVPWKLGFPRLAGEVLQPVVGVG